ATPQSLALLARAGVPPDSFSDLLGKQLVNWLAGGRKPGDKMNFNGLDYDLKAVFLNDLNSDEKLIKLLDTQQSTDHNVLKEHLNLTVRESQVLLWISNGKTNSEIAEILQMSPRTVNKHLEQVYPKLGVENRTAAARIALKVFADLGL
ncbi:MAG: helix-turn-helix transcriptional regulator, partial [Gammaproteobacteria bacterium]|nr:helix-turn-helix transcriptional regulator [Gammaproteobacteria bacterium]